MDRAAGDDAPPDSGRRGSQATVEWIEADYEGEGLRFQAEEVQRCLAAGRTESDIAPLDETVALARTMDDIRAQVGVVYAADSAT